jgi:hypothetical protein
MAYPVSGFTVSQENSMTATGRAAAVAWFLLSSLFAFSQTIPSGTHVSVRIGQEISSGKAEAGQSFQGTLARSIVVHGKTIAKAGAPVHGKVSEAKSSGRLHAPGELSLRLTSVNGHAVHTSAAFFKGKSHTKSNATKIGGGAALGTVVGALAGGGKGAAIGAAAGAGAGTGVAAATGKQEAVVHAESLVGFTVK